MTDPWGVVLLTLRVAAVATAVLVPPGVALAGLLAGRPFRGRVLLETLVSLPLVLPPTAVGLGLLLLFGRGGPFGSLLAERFGVEIAFTWYGAVLAAAVVALPLFVRAARSALEEVDPRLLGVARSLGRSSLGAFFAVHLPLAWRGLVGGAVLAFTRALGEFGATIVVAGNIPGRTQTLALALFQRVEVGRDAEALRLAGVAALLAFAALLAAETLSRRRQRALEG